MHPPTLAPWIEPNAPISIVPAEGGSEGRYRHICEPPFTCIEICTWDEGDAFPVTVLRLLVVLTPHKFGSKREPHEYH